MQWIDQAVGVLQELAWLRLDLLGRLLLAGVLGGLVGLEREMSGKPAGLRTNLLICIGAALLTEISVTITRFGGVGTPADPARIAAQIVSGIGFLGAGTIIQARGNVVGLTTAATLWVVAAIGIAVGAHAYVEAVGTTLLVLVALTFLARLEMGISASRRARTVELRMHGPRSLVRRAEARFGEGGLHGELLSVEQRAPGGEITAILEAMGPEEEFRAAVDELLDIDGIDGVTWE